MLNNTMSKKHGKCWYSQAELGLGINRNGSSGLCCVPPFHPSRLHTLSHTLSLSLSLSLSRTHARAHTQLIFQGLVLFGQRCANRRCNTSLDSSQKQGGETRWANKQPTLSHQETRDFSGFSKTRAKTHIDTFTHAVCNSSLYSRAQASGYLSKRWSKQS